jgi:hypothetical protein
MDRVLCLHVMVANNLFHETGNGRGSDGPGTSWTGPVCYDLHRVIDSRAKKTTKELIVILAGGLVDLNYGRVD